MFDAFSPFVEVILWFVGIALLVAIYIDIRERRIPNWLVLGVLFLGLLNVLLQQETAYLISFLVSLVVWGGLFYARVVGGGDAKLMMALSLFVLPPDLLIFYLCILIIGGLQAGLWLLLKKDKHMPYAVAIGLGSLVYYLVQLVAV